ncbi:PREDICTED: OTU domain-containing protein DDB_G0284757 isoform X2 [Tarenaya hassleriana]|uniref:OTU domain-containing protein DDB_G0284757 isoform X2 n=1 Tax=Tarenaya hassleriana TaxID=28532 RepID=UPI00053CA60E|nr:PREDICTED: OTU domain-containing protein DDB_G0284757 isoform X2 [Tarenaya hassleriana]
MRLHIHTERSSDLFCLKMGSHEESSSIADWFFGSHPYTNYPPYNVEIIQDHCCNDHTQRQQQPGEYNRNPDVESDVMIAWTLQDSFFPLETAENKERSPDTACVWNDQLTGIYSLEWVGNGRTDDSVCIYRCSDPSGAEESPYSRESTDRCDLDGEVGRRLNRMSSIPHVPKINGEIPSDDEAVTDHERLLNRLKAYGFREVRVQGDGNCQFRALSDQLYNNPERHEQVRHEIVNQLESCRKSYEGYVPMDYSEYLKKMSRSGEWGDHVTLQAAADTYRVRILVVTSYKDTCYIEILPTSRDYKRSIFLSFWAEVHYNSIYIERDTPSSPPDLQKKKKWWHFGN